jgi:hypothetical protein
MLQKDALHWKSEARRLVLGAIQALPLVNSDILVQKLPTVCFSCEQN